MSRFTGFLLVFLSLFSFQPRGQAAAQTAPTECLTSYDATLEYFPDRVTVDYASGFTVEYGKHYKLVTVKQPWVGAEQALRYLLVQCGAPTPTDIPADAVIQIPVQRFISMSTTFLPHLISQGVLDRLVGIDTAIYTNSASVLERVAARQTFEVGSGGSGQVLNVEQVLDLQPDLIMTQQYSAEDTSTAMIAETGLPFVLNADYLDVTPLGQAEWGKFISLFFNTEAAANAVFDGLQTRYHELAALAADAQPRPTVFIGTPFNGTWYMPGGQTYLAHLLADAGADYLWADDPSTGSLYLSFEEVFDRAATADYWLNVNQYWGTLGDALAEDERYGNFTAFQNDLVYTNNARTNANGGSDYYELGIANPDLILADLIAIFHPSLVSEHELYFYRQLGL